jgi:hypothetical protein
MIPKLATGLFCLASYPKSGNTWARVLLAHYLSGRAEPIPLDELGRYIFADSRQDLYREGLSLDAPPLDPATTLSARSHLLGRLAELAASRFLVVKTHTLNAVINGHPMFDPRQSRGAIYLVRHPLDVCASVMAHFAMSGDRAVDFLRSGHAALQPSRGHAFQPLGPWEQHVLSWHRQPGVLTVRYEDLLRDPEPVFRRMLQHLGAAIDPARLRCCLDAAAFETLQRQEQSAGFVEQARAGTPFFRSGRAGQGAEQLSPAQQQRLLAGLEPLLAHLGYA